MIIRKTLHEIYSELTELREMRKSSANILAIATIGEDKYQIERSLSGYKHYDEIIDYLSRIEVEYDDKYAEEEEE